MNLGMTKEIMVFSRSKNSGLSAARGGWVLAKDPKFIQGVISYLGNTKLGVSVDTQLCLLAHAKYIVEGHSEKTSFPIFIML
jgi:aspartate/methionine/tyrosine aminotransferase